VRKKAAKIPVAIAVIVKNREFTGIGFLPKGDFISAGPQQWPWYGLIPLREKIVIRSVLLLMGFPQEVQVAMTSERKHSQLNNLHVLGGFG
jgi:hypothetical protein